MKTISNSSLETSLNSQNKITKIHPNILPQGTDSDTSKDRTTKWSPKCRQLRPCTEANKIPERHSSYHIPTSYWETTTTTTSTQYRKHHQSQPFIGQIKLVKTFMPRANFQNSSNFCFRNNKNFDVGNKNVQILLLFSSKQNRSSSIVSTWTQHSLCSWCTFMFFYVFSSAVDAYNYNCKILGTTHTSAASM